MPAKAPRRHVIVSVAPKQLKAIDRDMKKAGLSRRMFMQTLTEEFLLAPTALLAGGTLDARYRPDRQRLRFHISEPLHKSVQKLAKQNGVPMSVIYATAIHNRYPI